MKESYSDDIMLCFVQGFGNSSDSHGCKASEYSENEKLENNNNLKSKKKQQFKRVSLQVESPLPENEVEIRSKRKDRDILTGKSLRLSSGDRLLKHLPEVKRSFSDRFSVVGDGTGRRPRSLLTIRKTWSTGNFAAGQAGGGGAPRSAPSTPLQLEPHPRPMKHDKQAVKPLSSSAPSVRVAALPGASGALSDASEGKAPSKARQKKFFRHFPQVGPDERVLNYYSCALVGDILLQGHLYITKNYFAFYSNVFGYVTKLLIPTSSVVRVTKEKMARIIPNAVGVCTRDERHVFGSLLSRDATHRLMTHVWKGARVCEAAPPPPQKLRISEAEMDASEFSVEDETSSAGGGDATDGPRPVKRRETDAIISGPSAAVIQPALLTAGTAVIQPALLTGAPTLPQKSQGGFTHVLMIVAALILSISAVFLSVRLYEAYYPVDEWENLSGSELYSELVRWRTRLHGKAASELQAFLSTNLLLLTKVRQSLETLSNVILADIAHGQDNLNVEIPPNDTTLS